MELSAQEDIEAPIDRVFATLSDFQEIERSVLRRGITVQRTDALQGPCAGMEWACNFRYRGKARQAAVTLSAYEPPHMMRFDSRSSGLDVVTRIDLVALSRTSTRVAMTVTLIPRTLSARLLVQSLKIARSNITRKFRARMSEAATEIARRSR